MSELMRIELGGRDSEAWNRVFAKLTGVVEKAVAHLVGDASAKTKAEAKEFAKDIADITKTWFRAKLEKPEIDNELKLAEIAERFEKIKALHVQRELAEVKLDEKRLDLWEKRMVTALKWLRFLTQCTVRDKDGNLTLVLSNQQLARLHADLKSQKSGLERI